MRRLLPILLLCAACSKESESPPALDAGASPDAAALPDAQPPADAGTAVDAGVSPDAEPAGDAQPAADGGADAGGTPTIAEALNCGQMASAGNLRPGTDLQRYDFDPALFPLARCNDGTPAVLYFRPAVGADNADRWVIQLQGGGACRTADDCARRWCSVGTNFGRTQMSSIDAPARGIGGDGILARGPGVDSAIQDYNQVFVRYCSSDGWSSRTGWVTTQAAHPRTQAPLDLRLAFDGADIVDAVLSLLRRDGAQLPPYTLGGGSESMNDLDDARTVLLAGASAGGGGVIFNADRLGELLAAHSTRCGVDGCTYEYRAIIDSSYGPRGESLDWSTSTRCTAQGACTWEQVLSSGTQLFASEEDASCQSWHAANQPATSYLCKDGDHVLAHHLDTPMLVRMGLTDQLISGNAIEANVSVPGAGVMTVALFSEIVRAQLLALGDLTDREEGRFVAHRPAVYGPDCPKHETLSSSPDTFRVTVPLNGTAITMLEALQRWRAGEEPLVAVNAPGDTPDCN